METPPAGTLPDAPAAPVVKPAEQPGSFSPPNADYVDPAVAALSLNDDILGFVENLKSTPAPKKAEPKPADKKPEDPPAEPPAKPADEPPAKPEEKPEGERPPEKPEEPAPGEQPAPAPEAKGDDDEAEDLEDDLTPLTAANIKLKPRADDDVFRLQLRIMKRNRDLTGEEARAMALKQLGRSDQPAPGAAPAPKPDGMPDTVEGINTEITKLKADRKAAADNLELKTYDELTERIEALNGKRGMLGEQQKAAAAKSQRDYDNTFAASKAEAEAAYAFAADPESPGGKAMIELDDFWERTRDPRFWAGNKPELLAQAISAKLKIPPVLPSERKKAGTAKPAPGVKPPPAPPAAKKDVIQAPGGAKTTPQTQATLKPLDAKIQDPKTTDAEYEKILRDIGVLN